MSKSTNGLRKAGLASLAVTLTLGAGIAGAGVANADADFEFTRIAGDNRYETAALVADTYATATTDEVILVNGEAGYYADALTANYLSGMRKAPILLTRDEFMPEATKTALADLDPAKVTIVGGEGVVPADQADWLESEGYTVERFAGANRFATNVEVIEAGGATTKDTGIVATGFDFADALGAGPAVYQGRPLGLSKSDDIDDAIVDALDASGVTKIVVLGGEAVVGQEVVDELEDAGFTVTRVDGADRSETSTEFADYAIANFGFTNTAADVASGYTLGSGADALAGGPLTGERNRPMLITKNLDNPGDLLNWLEAHAATLSEGVIYGGYGAVTASAEDRMEAAARSVSSNQDFTVTPQDEATVTDNDTAAGDTTDQRQYSVSGLDNTKTYTVALFNEDRVSVADNGTVTFLDASGKSQNGGQAGQGAVESQLEVINGSSTSGTSATAKPVNGTINFTVEGNGYESVVPVVFLNSDTDGLDLNADGTPVDAEPFGAGGTLNVVPAEAGTVDGLTGQFFIESVDKAANSVVGFYDRDSNGVRDADGANDTAGDTDDESRATMFYDTNDDYYEDTILVGNQLTMDEFEAILTAGDSFTSETVYQANEAFKSTFVLSNDAPGPLTINSTDADNKSITATVEADDIAKGATVELWVREDKADASDPAFTETGWTLAKSSTTDEDTTAAAPDFQITASGLNAGSAYDVAVRQVVDGEESAATEAYDVATDANPDTVKITDITVQDVNNGAGSTEVVIVTFDKDITACDAADFTVYPTAQPGLVFDADTCDATFGTARQVAFDLDAETGAGATDADNGDEESLQDAATDIEYTVKLAAGGVTTADGMSGDLTGTFRY